MTLVAFAVRRGLEYYSTSKSTLVKRDDQQDADNLMEFIKAGGAVVIVTVIVFMVVASFVSLPPPSLTSRKKWVMRKSHFGLPNLRCDQPYTQLVLALYSCLKRGRFTSCRVVLPRAHLPRESPVAASSNRSRRSTMPSARLWPRWP